MWRGLTAVSCKIRTLITDAKVAPSPLHCFKLVYSVVSHAEKRFLTSQITNACEDRLITYSQGYSRVHLSEIIRNPQRPKFRQTSFVCNIFFLDAGNFGGREYHTGSTKVLTYCLSQQSQKLTLCSFTYLPRFPNRVKANISVYQES